MRVWLVLVVFLCGCVGDVGVSEPLVFPRLGFYSSGYEGVLDGLPYGVRRGLHSCLDRGRELYVKDCMEGVALYHNDSRVCRVFEDGSKCVYLIATKTRNLSMCEDIVDRRRAEGCMHYLFTGVVTKGVELEGLDEGVCGEIRSAQTRDMCIRALKVQK